MATANSSTAPKKCVMVWNEGKDLTMLKEVAAEGVLVNRVGSRERGAAWQNVADSLNAIHGFGVTPRSLRDRFNILSKKLKVKLSKEVRESGGGDDGQSEAERLLEELMEVGEEAEKLEEQREVNKKAKEEERRQALEMRDRAMERFSETRKRMVEEKGEEKKEKRRRRSGIDGMEWLRERVQLEREMRTEEIESQREEREFQREQNEIHIRQLEVARQKQSEEMRMTQQCMLQQQQQQQQQQRQQFTAMQQQLMAIMQQQQQQSQALLALFNVRKDN